MADVMGTGAGERLVGTASGDMLTGLAGDDQLLGLGGDDLLLGGDGNDRLDGGTGADEMQGGLGDDSYVVDNSGDSLVENAGEGRDTVTTSVDYTLAAGLSIERFIAGGLLALNLFGNEIANSLYGNDAASRLDGRGGDDHLYGRGGGDTLSGGDGDDVLDGGVGADTMLGGPGNDVYYVDNVGDVIIEAAGEGDDRVVSSVNYTLYAEASVERLYSRGNTLVSLTGSDTNNAIIANNIGNFIFGMGGDDRLNGRGGDDTLFGGDGDDVLIGGTGADTLWGGTGDDTYYIDDAGDSVMENAGEGNDTALVSVNWTVTGGWYLETVILRGAADLDVTGNEFANTIHGNRGANVIDGGAGNDTLHVGVGDTATGGGGADSFIVTGDGAGTVRVIGDAADSLATTDTGWLFQGTSWLAGQAVDRYGRGTATLVADRDIDDSGVQATPAFGTGGINLGSLAPQRGFVITGASAGHELGHGVATAGDFNGDGLADVIIGVPYDGNGQTYVIFGKVDGAGSPVGGRQVLDVTTLSAADGFVIQGEAVSDLAGYSVMSAGDVNGDGLDDLIIGAPNSDVAGVNNGRSYVVFGTTAPVGTAVGGRQVLDLAALSAAEGFVINGNVGNSGLGVSVSAAGDINGDGLADLIVGANVDQPDGTTTGAAYVIFGSDTGFGTAVGGRQVISVASLASADGVVFGGQQWQDGFGISVRAAGDINGDGLDDLIVGAAGSDNNGGNSGEAYVIFGSTGDFGVVQGVRRLLSMGTLDSDEGFIIRGAAADDSLGDTVSAAGDINGDGFDDLIVGARFNDDAGGNAGAAYVVYGSADGFGANIGGRQIIDLNTLQADEGFILLGRAGGVRFGRGVSDAGDVNGDGLDDILVTSPYDGNSSTGSGRVFLIFGTGDGLGTVDGAGRQVFNIGNLDASQGVAIRNPPNVGQGQILSAQSAGDVNGDGYDDIVIGAARDAQNGTRAGMSYVVYGGPDGLDLNVITGVNPTGSSAAERLIGTSGDDVLIGNGGADVFMGGAGNDTIDIGVGDFFRVDGGNGFDTLVFTGNLDFSLVDTTAIRNVEALDVTGNGAQEITLTARDVLNFKVLWQDSVVSFDNLLILYGDGADSLRLTGLTDTGLDITQHGIDYDIYALNGRAVLAVDQDFMLV